MRLCDLCDHGNMNRMAEAGDRRIAIRCATCRRRPGPSPLLGYATGPDPDPDPTLSGGWVVSAYNRPAQSNRHGAAIEGERIPHRPRGIELWCRRCGSCPRVRFTRIHRMADQAYTDGCGDIYV